MYYFCAKHKKMITQDQLKDLQKRLTALHYYL